VRGTRTRFSEVILLEQRGTGKGAFYKIAPSVQPAAVPATAPEQNATDKSGAAELWIRASDLSLPTKAPRPANVADGERWIDIDLASQTLVAFEGDEPRFATIVSTGRGAQGTETATPKGTFRIWAKLFSTAMDNLEREDAEHYYSIDEVPWVQFFHKGVALHGAFWHKNFGRIQSHGCVNLSPIDAELLFTWTSPHLGGGWSAALPSPVDAGTVIRVR
jgi:lipoprotein-anchoring transpeptidase ErfK/SrfK